MKCEKHNLEYEGACPLCAKDIEVTVVVDKSKEVESLVQERDDLKIKLEMVAQKQFQQKAIEVGKRIGLSESESLEQITNEKALDYFRGVAEGKESKEGINPETGLSYGSGGAGVTPLPNSKRGSGSETWLTKEYESLEEMVDALKDVASSGERCNDNRLAHSEMERLASFTEKERTTAKQILNKMTKMQLEKDARENRHESATFTGTFQDMIKGKTKPSDWEKSNPREGEQ
jgi:hypothetical protein